MNRRDLKIQAKVITRNNKNRLALICFIFSLIVGAISATGFGAIITLIIIGPLTMGFIKAIKDNEQGLEPRVETLFSDFKANFFDSFLLFLLRDIFTFLWTLLFIIPGIIKSLAYSMAPFIHQDHPEYSANECIKKSNELMKGHKSELFWLELSYIWWYLLGILTLGILFFWIEPKVMTAEYLFYKKISGEPTIVD